MIDLLPLLFVWAVAMACGWEDEWSALFAPVDRFARTIRAGWAAALEFLLDFAGLR